MVKLSGLLMFTTGCKAVPPMGFNSPITILQNDSALPNANTCPLVELEVLGVLTTYEKSMDTALEIQEEGFCIV